MCGRQSVVVGVVVLFATLPFAASASDQRERYEEFLELFPTSEGLLPSDVVNGDIFSSLLEPASYDILNYAEGEGDSCRRYVIDDVMSVEARRREEGVPTSFALRLRGRSAGFCEVVTSDLPYDECHDAPEGTGCDCDFSTGTSHCILRREKPMSLILWKRGGVVRVRGLTDVIRIHRKPMEQLPYEWGGEEMYDYTPVRTHGTLTSSTLSDGTVLRLYRTPWQSILADLRGIRFFLFERRFGPALFRALHEYPRHNLSEYFWRRSFGNYETCLRDGTTPFCMERDGNAFVIASRSEPLGTVLTLWVDEHFRR